VSVPKIEAFVPLDQVVTFLFAGGSGQTSARARRFRTPGGWLVCPVGSGLNRAIYVPDNGREWNPIPLEAGAAERLAQGDTTIRQEVSALKELYLLGSAGRWTKEAFARLLQEQLAEDSAGLARKEKGRE